MDQAQAATRRSRGERAGLSRADVLAAAVDVADREGIDRLSMRRLAAALDVQAMTIYHYVPSRDALLDGLVEHVLTQAASPTAQEGELWPTALRRYAVSLRQTLLAHPGILPIALSRPAATTRALHVAEDALRVLVNAGFAVGRALDAFNVLTVFVVGHTVAEVSINRGDNEAGTAAAILEEDDAELPLLMAAARSGDGTDDAERFCYGLDALLAGLQGASFGDSGSPARRATPDVVEHD